MPLFPGGIALDSREFWRVSMVSHNNMLQGVFPRSGDVACGSRGQWGKLWMVLVEIVFCFCEKRGCFCFSQKCLQEKIPLKQSCSATSFSVCAVGVALILLSLCQKV